MLNNSQEPESESGSDPGSSDAKPSFTSGPDDLWGSLLSRQPALIRSVYTALDLASRHVVINHLQLMATQPGWQPQQIQSAKFALEVLGDQN